MWDNFKKNHFISETGVETFILGAYFVYVRDYFVGFHRFAPVFEHFADPYIAIGLVVIGSLSVFVGLWDVHWFNAKRVALTAMQVIWTVYFVVFLLHDLNMTGPIDIGTILSGAVMIRIFVEALWGGRK